MTCPTPEGIKNAGLHLTSEQWSQLLAEIDALRAERDAFAGNLRECQSRDSESWKNIAEAFREKLTASELARAKAVEALKYCLTNSVTAYTCERCGETHPLPDLHLKQARKLLSAQPYNYTFDVLREVEKRMSEECVGSDEYGQALAKLRGLLGSDD